jgi:hypothetical protein
VIRRVLLVVSLLAVLPVAYGASLTFMLTVTTADTTGRCLYQDRWVEVSGRYHAWDLKEIFPKKGLQPSKDDPWRVVRTHSANQLHPITKPPSTTSSTGVISSDISFVTPMLAMSEEQLNFYENRLHAEEYRFLRSQRESLSNKNLVLTTVIAAVSESALARLNRLNSSSPFKDGSTSDSQINIPLSYSVCDLSPVYLMNQSTAIYQKGFFGRKTLLEDNTKPMQKGRKTFAEEFIER